MPFMELIALLVLVALPILFMLYMWLGGIFISLTKK